MKIGAFIYGTFLAFTVFGVLGFFFGGCESPEGFNPPAEPRACNFDTLTGYGYMIQCANGDKLCMLYDGTFADAECVYKDAKAPVPFYCAEGCK